MILESKAILDSDPRHGMFFREGDTTKYAYRNRVHQDCENMKGKLDYGRENLGLEEL